MALFIAKYQRNTVEYALVFSNDQNTGYLDEMFVKENARGFGFLAPPPIKKEMNKNDKHPKNQDSK